MLVSLGPLRVILAVFLWKLPPGTDKGTLEGSELLSLNPATVREV